MSERGKRRRWQRRKTISLIVLTTYLVLIPLIAYAPPAYKELDKVKVIDSTVINNTAIAENLTGSAGWWLLINTPLAIPNQNGQLLQISFKLKNDIAGGKLTIKWLDNPSVAPPANALGFFQITIEGFSDSDIETAEITLRLGNEYVNVQLYRLTGSQWVALPTSRVETGTDSSTYRAESPGLSEFAITANKGRVKAEAPALPYTSGDPIYLVAVAGILFIIIGLTLKFRPGAGKQR